MAYGPCKNTLLTECLGETVPKSSSALSAMDTLDFLLVVCLHVHVQDLDPAS